MTEHREVSELFSDSPQACSHGHSFITRDVWFLFGIGTILRILSFVFGKNNGGDALARATLTAGWLQHPTFRLNFEPWLPLHFWLMGGFALLVGNPALGARLLSLTLGIASLGVCWFLAGEIYGRSAAVLSLLVFALYSLHIGYSGTSSSEVPYLFFVLAGMLGFFVNRRTGSVAALCLSAVALGVASGIRYEAWVCIVALVVVMIVNVLQADASKRRLSEILLFAAISGVWPAFWLFYQWKAFGRPLYGVTMNYSWVPEQAALLHRSGIYKFVLPPGVLLITLTPIVLAAAMYGLWMGLQRNNGRDFCIIVLISASAFVVQISLGGLLPLARYTITLGTFLAIAAGYGLEAFGSLLSAWRGPPLRVALAALLALDLIAILVLSQRPNQLGDKMAAVSPVLRFPEHVDLVGRYLVPRLDASKSVVIDDYNVESNIVASAIGLPLLKGDRAFLLSEQPVSALPQYITQKRPAYLIYSDKGTLRTVIPLPDDCAPSSFSAPFGMSLSCVFKDDTYRVYSIAYSPKNAKLASR